ncbi:MAG: hypothetical protein KGI58_02880 [Patescibacteria group bacterium]|nr:hypothetical protein [Patescibacteria group bacterium]
MRNLDKILDLEKKYKLIMCLTANENVLSPKIQKVLAFDLGSRYYMGSGIKGIALFGRNAAFKGMPELDFLIKKSSSFIMDRMNAKYVIYSCLSGVHAMISIIITATNVGDVIMSVPSSQGGHFCTKGIIESTSRKHVDTEYDYKIGNFDIKKIANIVKREKVKMIYFDVSVYIKPLPIKEIRSLIGDNVIIVYDASHVLGLIIGNEFQSPLKEGADIICGNTHKTFPGPHKAIVAFKDEEFGKIIDKKINESFVSTVNTGNLITLLMTVMEMKKWGILYSKQIISNSNELAYRLEKLGFKVRRASLNKYTYNHQIHVFVNEKREQILEKFLNNNINVSTSGALGGDMFIRIGVQEITRRGLKERDMSKIAQYIKDVIDGKNIKKNIICFMKNHTKIYYSI